LRPGRGTWLPKELYTDYARGDDAAKLDKLWSYGLQADNKTYGDIDNKAAWLTNYLYNVEIEVKYLSNKKNEGTRMMVGTPTGKKDELFLLDYLTDVMKVGRNSGIPGEKGNRFEVTHLNVGRRLQMFYLGVWDEYGFNDGMLDNIDRTLVRRTTDFGSLPVVYWFQGGLVIEADDLVYEPGKGNIEQLYKDLEGKATGTYTYYVKQGDDYELEPKDEVPIDVKKIGLYVTSTDPNSSVNLMAQRSMDGYFNNNNVEIAKTGLYREEWWRRIGPINLNFIHSLGEGVDYALAGQVPATRWILDMPRNDNDIGMDKRPIIRSRYNLIINVSDED